MEVNGLLFCLGKGGNNLLSSKFFKVLATLNITKKWEIIHNGLIKRGSPTKKDDMLIDTSYKVL